LGLETDSEIVYFNRARARYDRGDMAGAIADYSRAIELNDNEPAYYSNRALVYIAQEKWNEALRDLSAAIDRQAPESRVYYLRSQVLDALGKPDEAAADLQLFLELPAIDAESLVTRSVVHWQQGQQDKALADVAAAAILDPTSVEAWQNQAAFLSALPERGAAAIEAMDQVVDLQPENPVARASRGVLHARLGNVDQARQDAEQALQLDTTADTQYRVAGIYALLAQQPGLEKSMNDRAWQLLRAALSAQPQLVAAYIQNDPDIESLKSDARWQELKQVLQALELWPSETTDGSDRS
jgi:tetratricopeptide (TPR) repeat protein